MKRRRKKGFTIPGRQLLLIITAVCFILIGLSFFTETSFAPLRFFANITVVPMAASSSAFTDITRKGFYIAGKTGTAQQSDIHPDHGIIFPRIV